MATSYGSEFYITSVMLPEDYSPERHAEFTEIMRERAEGLSLGAAAQAYANSVGIDADTDEEARQAIIDAVDLVLNSEESNVAINVHGERFIVIVVATGTNGGSTDGWDEMDAIDLLLNARLLNPE